MKKVGLAVILGVGLLDFQAMALACLCLPPSSPNEALERADAVFVGSVEHFEAREKGEQIDSFDKDSNVEGSESVERASAAYADHPDGRRGWGLRHRFCGGT